MPISTVWHVFPFWSTLLTSPDIALIQKSTCFSFKYKLNGFGWSWKWHFKKLQDISQRMVSAQLSLSNQEREMWCFQSETQPNLSSKNNVNRAKWHSHPLWHYINTSSVNDQIDALYEHSIWFEGLNTQTCVQSQDYKSSNDRADNPFTQFTECPQESKENIPV